MTTEVSKPPIPCHPAPMPYVRTPAALVTVMALSVASPQKAGNVTLLKPYEVATVTKGSQNEVRLEALESVDPAHPGAEGDAQILSLFGREDLISPDSENYKSTGCKSLKLAGRVDREIIKRSRQTSIVIINESHERSEHRYFTGRVIKLLRTRGYSALALEGLSNPPASVPSRYQPSVIRQPGLPFFEDGDGYYLGEAEFGRLGRLAKRLGYVFIPYEAPFDEKTATMSPAAQIASREEAQANALAAWINTHPKSKIIVHVGYSHATETIRSDGNEWMAARLRKKLHIDPLTISQTTCRGGGIAPRLARLPSDEPVGAFDLIIDHPAARFTRNRPSWRILNGDIPVPIPADVRPDHGWRVVEARPEGEPVTSVPMDRVAIRPGEDVALMLPPGRYHLRIVDAPFSKQSQN